MKFLKRLALTAAVFVGMLGIMAQTSSYLPIPSNVCTAKGGILVAYDATNATCVAAVAAGKVLISAGTGTLPAWGDPLFGASGTTITQIRVHQITLSATAVGAGGCYENELALVGIAATDKLFINVAAVLSPAIVGIRPSDSADAFLLNFCNPGNDIASSSTGTATIVAIRTS